jgi:hypothetical protein
MANHRDDAARRLLTGFPSGDPTGLGIAPSNRISAAPDRWVVATLAMLSVSFLALAAYVITHPPAPIVIAQPMTGTAIEPGPPAEIRIAVRDATRDPDPRAHALSASVEVRDDASSGIAVATSDDRSPRGTVRTRKIDRATPRADDPPKVERGVSVDCVLEPTKPGCAGANTPPPKGPPPPTVGADRPLTLAQSEIRAGIAPLKPTAKACAARHGAKPGETVRIKLSIAGPTGNVISTSAEPPHQGTPLGNCVAAALKKASFATFRKPVIGLVYAITM